MFLFNKCAITIRGAARYGEGYDTVGTAFFTVFDHTS